MQNSETEPLFNTIHKNQLKMDYILDIRSESKTFLEENIGSNLLNFSLGDDFLNLTPKVNASKAKIK